MRKNFGALLLVALTTVYVFSHRMSVVPFYDLFMQRFHITYAEAGGLLSAFFVGYALLMIPAGIMADRFEARTVLLFGLALVGTSGLGFALCRSYQAGLAMRFLSGVGTALVHPSAVRILAANFDRGLLGLAIGVREAAAGAGILVALSVVPLLSARLNPDHLFLGLALLWLPIAAGFSGIRPSGEIPDGRARPGRYPVLAVLARKEVLHLAGASFFGLFSMNGFLGWFPTYLEKTLGLGKGLAGVVTGAHLVAMTALSLFGGHISDLLGKRRPVMVLGSALLGVVLLLLTLKIETSMAFLASLAGAGTGLAMPPLLTLAAETVTVDNAGLVISIVTAIGQLASALTGFSLGWILDRTGGFALIWLAMLVSLGVQTMFLSLLRER